MTIEPLSVHNLRDGVFCAKGKPHGEDMYQQLEAWVQGKALRGQVARAEDGKPVGFVLYFPIEEAPLDISGEGFYVVQCIYVRPGYQHKGIGRALIETALADAQMGGATGLAVEGFRQQRPGHFDYLPGSFFQHIGLSSGESRGPATLYYVSFSEPGPAPRYMAARPPEQQERYRVRIDLFDCRKCHRTIDNTSVVKAVARTLGEKRIRLVIHDQNTREAVVDKGMSHGMFVDGALTYFQGPVVESDVMSAIEVAESARRRSSDR